MNQPVDGHPTVFISHASADAERATLLRMHLEHAGLRCWMAPRDIPAGQRYAEGILQGIESTTVFLLLVTAESAASTHVLNEVEEAASRGRSMFVVRLDQTDPSSVPSLSFFLRSHQWFDASSGPITAHLESITSDIAKLVDRLAAERAALEQQHQQLSTPVPPAVDASPARSAPRRRSGPRAIGLDIDAASVRGCVTYLEGPDGNEPSDIVRLDLPATSRNARGLLDAVRSLAGRLVDQHCQDEPPAGIGLAVPGQVDVRAGSLKFGPNLYGARNLPFRSYLAGAHPRTPVRVDNDVRCSTRTELHIGVGRQFDSFACIFVGDGVGSGSVLDRRIHFGHNYCAGEIGHTKVAQAGPPCSCGQIGCLESFVKASAIVERARAKAIDYEGRDRPTSLIGAEPLTTQAVLAAVDAGDAAANELADEVGQSLGLGIANYLNLVNPAAVVLGGPLMTGFYFPMLDAITGAVQRNALAEVVNTPIVQSAHGDDAVVLGASLMFHPDDGWPY